MHEAAQLRVQQIDVAARRHPARPSHDAPARVGAARTLWYGSTSPLASISRHLSGPAVARLHPAPSLGARHLSLPSSAACCYLSPLVSREGEGIELRECEDNDRFHVLRSIWRYERVPHLRGIFGSWEPVGYRSSSMPNTRTGLETGPTHDIPVDDCNQTHP